MAHVGGIVAVVAEADTNRVTPMLHSSEPRNKYKNKVNKNKSTST